MYLKSIQNLSSQTRSDMCKTLLNILPIYSEIDARKLLFFLFFRLCRMSCQSLPKQIFLIRLSSFFAELGKKTTRIHTINRIYCNQRITESQITVIFLKFFSQFLKTRLHPSSFWQILNNCYEIRLGKFICKLITNCPQDSLYVSHLCGNFLHVTCSCAITFKYTQQMVGRHHKYIPY